MEILVLILIIWVIVRRAKLAQQRQGTRPNVPRQQNRPQQARPAQGYRMPQQARPAQGYQMPQQAYQAAQPTYVRSQQNGGQAYGARQSSKGAQQRGVGQRLAQWRGQQSQGGGRTSQQAQSNDILTRAAANVRENEQDELERQMLDGTQTLVNAIDIEGTSELMREIDDLMIMGYQADLSFERDFVAEGVEMLNSYELPAEI